ncbi:Retinoic acid receptor responder protein 3 [Merluccius polli]|uniref:Retinoic acid receptor responder protein 3 n=1 Tax=Merluccius polli TaxID=89951 RepID=A0AA47NB66_MERPO|nr:Retinoic acid receptor responder protein 3 [Merluccius polli]
MAPTQFDDEPVPKPGDLIQVSHSVYQHWAVYIGDGYVVHLTYLAKCVTTEKAMVKMDRLQDVFKNSDWNINNTLDEEYEPLPAHVVVMAARRLVDSVMPYCVLWKNCEHFATELCYGKPESREI